MPVFIHRVFSYSPHKPRNPLLRLLVGMLGLVLMLVLLVVGLFVGLGMLMFAAVRRLARPSPRNAASDRALDGEYTVVEKRSASLGLH